MTRVNTSGSRMQDGSRSLVVVSDTTTTGDERLLFKRMSHRASTGDSQREHHAAVGKATGETERAGVLE